MITAPGVAEDEELEPKAPPEPVTPPEPPAPEQADDAVIIAEGQARERAIQAKQAARVQDEGLSDQIIRRAISLPPERAARVLDAGRRTGVDLDVVNDNLDDLEVEMRKDGFNAEVFRRTSPTVRAWLQKSRFHYAVGRADIDKLNNLELSFARVENVNHAVSDADVIKEMTERAKRHDNEQKLQPEFFNTYADPSAYATKRPTISIEERTAQYIKERQAQERFIAQLGELGPGDVWEKNVRENPLWWMGYGGAINAMAKSYELYKAATAEKPTEDQLYELKMHRRLQLAAEERGTSVTGMAAEILMGMPAFLQEFGLGKAGFTATKAAVEKALAKGIAVGAEKSMAVRAAGTAVGAMRHTATAGLPRIGGDIFERMTPDVKLTPGDNGKIDATILAGTGDGAVSATLKSVWSNYVEILTEHMGAGAAEVGKKVAGAALGQRAMQFFQKSTALKWLQLNPGSKTDDFLARLKALGGWDGVFGEGMEERYGELMKAPVEGKYEPPTMKQLIAEQIAFMTMPVGSMLVKAATSGRFKRPLTPSEQAQIEADKTLLGKIGKITEDMTMPEAQREEAIKAVVVGTPSENVYADTKRFDKYWEGKKDADGNATTGVTEAAKLGVTPEVYQEALENGHRLKIPTEKYAVKIAPTEHNGFFQDELSLNPELVGAREAKEQLDEYEKQRIEVQAMEKLTPERVEQFAVRAAKKEAREKLAELKKGDMIARVTGDGGARVYSETIPTELVESGIPASMIAQKGDRGAVPLDEMAAKYGMDAHDLLQNLAVAAKQRRDAEEGVTSPQIPAHIADAAMDQVFLADVAKLQRQAVGRKKAVKTKAEAKRQQRAEAADVAEKAAIEKYRTDNPGETIGTYAAYADALRAEAVKKEAADDAAQSAEEAAEEAAYLSEKAAADEALHAKFAEAAERARMRRWINKSAKEFGEGVRRGLMEAGKFGRDAWKMAILAEKAFKRAAERGGIVAVEKLFARYNLTINAREAPTIDEIKESLLQPAFHGTAAEYDKVDLSKIGTGEGSAKNGWGLNVSQSKTVAETYRDSTTHKLAQKTASYDGQYLFETGAKVTQLQSELGFIIRTIPYKLGISKEIVAEAVSRSIQYFADALKANPGDTQMAAQLAALRTFDKSKLGGIPAGRVYHLEIPDTGYLNFEEKLRNQEPDVQSALWSLGFGAHDGDLTGRDAYEQLVMRFTQKRLKEGAARDMARGLAKIDASKLLSQNGVTGNKYKDQVSRFAGQTADSTYNFVIFKAEDVTISGYEQEGDAAPRGMLNFGNLPALSIDLFSGRDKSTPLHELAHFFLEAMVDVSALETADDGIKADVEAFFRMAGVTREQWAGMSIDKRRSHHEKWATSFEKYLMDGVAPSEDLQSAFASFKSWLIEIYKDLMHKLPESVSPELRGIFDRMLASEEEIDDILSAEGRRPLFEAGMEAGMTPSEARSYAKALEKMRVDAIALLGAKLMKSTEDMDSEWWKEELEKIRREEDEKVGDMPQYKALGAFKNGLVKLDFDILKNMAPNSTGTGVDERIPTYVYKKGGTHPDIVAGMYQYKGGADRMVKDLLTMPPRHELVEDRAQQRMIEEHGTEPTPAERQKLGEEIIAAGAHEDVIQMEMNALARLSAKQLRNMAGVVARPPSLKLIQEQVATKVALMPVGELDARRYMTDAKAAQKEAIRLLKRGDFAGALEAKRQQAVNLAYFNSITKGSEYVMEKRKGFAKFRKSDEKLKESRDLAYVNAGRAILAQMNIGNRGTQASEYLADLKDLDPSVYEFIRRVIDSVAVGDQSYEEMTYAEFYEASEAVEAMWKLAGTSRQNLVDGKRTNREEIVETLIARLNAFRPITEMPGPKQTTEGNVTIRGLIAAMTRMEAWVDAVDGDDPSKPFRRYIFNPVSDGVNLAKELHSQKTRQLDEILRPIAESFTKTEIAAPELDFVFKDFAQLMGALSHIGNAGNLRRLIVGNKWGELSEDHTTFDRSKWDQFFARIQQDGTITEAHMRAIQQIWDLTKSMKAGVWLAHAEIEGGYPESVIATPVVTRWGTFEGGYVPAIQDSNRSTDAAIREAAAEFDNTTANKAFGTVGNGATKSRAKLVAQPLIMDLNRIRSHLWWAARYTHIEPRVREVARLVKNRKLAERLLAHNPVILKDLIMPWLQRSASQNVETPVQSEAMKTVMKWLRIIRRRSGLELMIGNTANAIQNITGLSLAKLRVDGQFLFEGIQEAASNPLESAKWVAEKSLMMKHLSYNEMVGAADDITEILTNPSVYQKAVKWTERNGMCLQRLTQGFVNRAVWIGAYNQAKAKPGMTEIEAVREADSTVRMTQGSGSAEDVSRMETGNAFIRIFTQFSSYFNMWANLNAAEYSHAMRDAGVENRAARVAVIYAWGMLLPTIITEAIMMSFRGSPPDDDDNGKLDELAWLLGLGHLHNIAAMVPGVGQLARLATGDQNRFGVAPAVSVLEQALQAPQAAFKYFTDDEKGRGTARTTVIRDTLTLLGMTTGLPFAALKRPATYLSAVEEDRADAEGPMDVIPGLLGGPAKKRK